jgi:selenocysteine-specific translation elongation factor
MDLKDEFEVKEADARRWAEAHDLPVFFTSALNGQGIDNLKKSLAKKFVEVSADQGFQMVAGSTPTERLETGGCCS